MTVPDVPDWKTDDMIRAEAALGEATHTLGLEMERARQVLENTRDEPLSEEEVELFRQQCTTPEWQEVATRVARGEFTWREIAEGDVGYDEGIEAAMRSMLPRPEPVPEPEDDEDYFATERFIERE